MGRGRVQRRSSGRFVPDNIILPERSAISTDSERNVAVQPCEQSWDIELRLWLRVSGWKMCAVMVTLLSGIAMEMHPREVMCALFGRRTDIVVPEGMMCDGMSDDLSRKSVVPVSASVVAVVCVDVVGGDK